MNGPRNGLVGLLAADLIWALSGLVLLMIAEALPSTSGDLPSKAVIINAWIGVGALLGVATLVSLVGMFNR